jgi:hypothetical protein
LEVKKLIVIGLILAVMALNVAVVFAEGPGDSANESFGPAPNSGDGIPDGSGFDSPNEPNGDGPGDSANEPFGPSPNSGDGIPDGSGFDSPNGPNN